MRGLAPLLKKELWEQWRTYKFLIVGGIFLFFGITTPLMLKYLPEILQLTGEQLVIEMPPPTAADSLIEYAGTIGQVGVLVAVLVAMGSIAGERRRGTMVMTLSKPVTRLLFVSAKLIAMALNFGISLVIASAFCYGYTVWLIGAADISAYIYMNLLVGVFLVFCLAVTVLYSSLFRSSLAAGGLAIASLIGQGALSAVPVFGDYMPGKILGWGNGLVTGQGESYWWALGINLIVIVLCVYLARRRLHRRDL